MTASMVTRSGTTASEPPAPKSGLIWLASYPKSGNTWVRIFLSNLAAIMAGETEKLALNAITRFSHSADFQLYFEEILGFKPTAQHATKLQRFDKKCSRQLPIPLRVWSFSRRTMRWSMIGATRCLILRSHRAPSISFAIRSTWRSRLPITVATASTRLSKPWLWMIANPPSTISWSTKSGVHGAGMSRVGRVSRIRRSVSCATKTC